MEEKPAIRWKRLFVLLLALIVVMVGLIMLINYLPVSPGTFDQSQASNTFDDMTNVERFVYEVDSRMVQITLQLDVTLARGAAAWTFTDPNGLVRWEGQLEPGQEISETRSFAPVAGQW
ncbi:MAG: YpmS family protein, partial [Gammaproteobacteria bacterium]|nr:YpmS family protein [Gammaproteobacteria bacterium]